MRHKSKLPRPDQIPSSLFRMNSHQTQGWNFHPTVEGARAVELRQYSRYEEILALVFMTLQVRGFVWEDFTGARLAGCRRAAFLVEVAEKAYDAFFNAPCGYRAQYAISAAQGEEANRFTLKYFATELLNSINELPPLEHAQVKISLLGHGAKVWIHEPEVQGQLGREAPEIDFDQWEVGCRTADTDGAGMLAPVGTELVFLGGWLDDSGKEYMDPFKADRSGQIHNAGFT